jgi:putative transposase
VPWREMSVVDRRREFVRLALQAGANRRELCRRFGISHSVCYKWLARWAAGDHELCDHSRRPHTHPGRWQDKLEKKVLAIRDAHPVWGARKIAGRLDRQGIEPPAVSTVHAILRRHDRLSENVASPGKPYCRFEKEAPNLLWQMDFKGWVALTNGTRCHPLTVIDDHSRYVPCLKACDNQQTETVQGHLETTFRRHGLPDAFYVDNGSPWGDPSGQHWTRLSVWLLKLGVEVINARAYHPQGRGKNERFHRTLKAEVFAFERFDTIAQIQRAFDVWRDVYNCERPHEALGQNVPASRYRPSARTMPRRLPEVEYDAHEIVRTVSTTRGYISFKGRSWRVPQAFCGERVAIRAMSTDGQYGVFFASHRIAGIELQ